jgi:hypothetical protein
MKTSDSFYERFIMKARHCNYLDCGADDRYIQSLKELEAFEDVSMDIFYKPRLNQVKQYVTMALVIGIMKNLSSENEEQFYRLIHQVEAAENSIPILEACEEGYGILCDAETLVGNNGDRIPHSIRT